MATTYGQVEREVQMLLANVVGGDVTTMETNYAAASTAANRLNPDIAFTPVRDAIVDVLAEVRLAIAETPRYIEWSEFTDFVTGVASPQLIPASTGAGVPRIGPLGVVEDAVTARPLVMAPLDDVKDYALYSAGIYAGLDTYLYAFSGRFIYHTRGANLARVWFNTYVRDTYSFAGNIPLKDHHVPAIIQGTVARIAMKEGRYQRLFMDAEAKFQAHLQGIRAYALKTGGETADTPSSV